MYHQPGTDRQRRPYVGLLVRIRYRSPALLSPESAQVIMTLDFIFSLNHESPFMNARDIISARPARDLMTSLPECLPYRSVCR